MMRLLHFLTVLILISMILHYLPIECEGSEVVNNWTIGYGETVVKKNVIIYVHGNITVKTGGKLHLINSKIIMNSTKDSTHSIVVEGVGITGGEIILENSEITANSSDSRYDMIVYPGAKLRVRESIISRCGTNISSPTGMGPTILTRDAEIEGSVFKDSTVGLVCGLLSKVTIKNSEIKDNQYGGLYITGGDVFVEGSVIKNNRIAGVISTASSPEFKNTEIRENLGYGCILSISGKSKFINCKIKNNFMGGILSYGTDLIMSNCILSMNFKHISINGASGDIRRCTISGGYVALEVNQSELTIDSSSIKFCAMYGISLVNDSEIKCSQTKIESCENAFSSSKSQSVITDSTMSSNMIDISLHSESTSKVLNTTFSRKVIDESSTFYVGWYATVSVIYPDNSHVPHANVEVLDRFGNEAFRGETDDTGMCGPFEIYEYVVKGSNMTSYNPYNFTAIKFQIRGTTNYNITSNAHIKILLDTLPPTIFIDYPKEGNVINSSKVSIYGRSYDNENVEIVEISVDGGKFSPANGTTHWKIDIDLSDGIHKITARAIDNSGNSRIATVNFTVDTTPPIIEIREPSEGDIFPNGNITIIGVTEPNALINCMNVEGYADSNGNFTLNITIDVHGEDIFTEINITVIDIVGNKNETSVNVIIDSVPPIIEIYDFLNGSVVRYSNITIHGKTEDNATVTISNITYKCNETGLFHINISLYEGVNDVLVKAQDEAGNINDTIICIVVDTIPPELIIDSPKNKTITNRGYINIIGTLINGTEIVIGGKAYTVKNERFNISIPLEEGENAIEILGRDVAGNWVKKIVYVLLDTIPPDIEIFYPAHGSQIYDEKIEIIGRSEPYAKIYVRDKETICDENGNFILRISLNDGLNILQVRAEDSAGNSNIKTISVQMGRRTTEINLEISHLILIISCAVIVGYLVSAYYFHSKIKKYAPIKKEEE